MSYSIEFSQEALSDIDFLNRADRRLLVRIINKIESLQDNPGAGKPLVGNHKGEFSLRVGSYRIVYEPAGNTIHILTIKHRKHVY
jgi:mRNA interferase RelE/StbE